MHLLRSLLSISPRLRPGNSMILNSDMWKIWGRFQSGSFSYNAQSHNFQNQIWQPKAGRRQLGVYKQGVLKTNTTVFWSQWDEKIQIVKAFEFILLKSLFLPTFPLKQAFTRHLRIFQEWPAELTRLPAASRLHFQMTKFTFSIFNSFLWWLQFLWKKQELWDLKVSCWQLGPFYNSIMMIE